jgi:hypothetical protein
MVSTFKCRPDLQRLKFTDQTFSSVGSLMIFFPTPGALKTIAVEIVSADVSLIIGLDILNEFGWNFRTLENK